MSKIAKYKADIFDEISNSIAGIEGFLELLWEYDLNLISSNIPSTLKVSVDHANQVVDRLQDFVSRNYGEISVECASPRQEPGVDIEAGKMLRVIFKPVKKEGQEIKDPAPAA